MFCQYCGAEHIEDAGFCPRCGRELPYRSATAQSGLFDARAGTRPAMQAPATAYEPSKLKGFLDGAVPIGDFAGGFILGPVVFFLVLAGVIEATASPPGGMLRGSAGAVASFGQHALWGVLAAAYSLVEWLGVVLLVLGLVGALRRRAPWFAAPVGLVTVVAFGFLDALRNGLSDLLGSVSASDAAPFWAALVATYISMGVRVLSWVREIWLWSTLGAARP